MKVLTLKTCDTCRKALRWLDDERIAYESHDIRTSPPDRSTVERIIDAVGPERAVNRRSTTWRNLAAKPDPLTAEHAADLIVDEPTLMKRPVFLREGGSLRGGDVLVGFDENVKTSLR